MKFRTGLIAFVAAFLFLIVAAFFAKAGEVGHAAVSSSTKMANPWTLILQDLVASRVPSPISAKYTWVSMNVTGPVVVGGPPVTLYGDAKSINAQVLKMNPKYSVDNFVEKTVTPPGEPASAVVPPLCNNWPQGGSINLLEEGIVDLNQSVFPVVVPIHSCVALSCIDGASIGICNDNNEPITKITRNLVVYLEMLINYCLSSTGTVNGQVFDTGKFNLVFDSGHCTPPAQGSNYQGDTSAGATAGNQPAPNDSGVDTSAGATEGNQPDPNDTGYGGDTSPGATVGNQSAPNDYGSGGDTSAGATDGNEPVRQPKLLI